MKRLLFIRHWMGRECRPVSFWASLWYQSFGIMGWASRENRHLSDQYFEELKAWASEGKIGPPNPPPNRIFPKGA